MSRTLVVISTIVLVFGCTSAQYLGAGQQCENSTQCDPSQKLFCEYVENEGNICVKIMDVSQQCGDKTWICDKKKGLVCDQNNKCMYASQGNPVDLPAATVYPSAPPAPGMSKQNGPCMGDLSCPDSLKCQYVGRYKTCVREMNAGGSCGDRSWVCKPGLTCYQSKCYMFGGEGRKCNDPFWKCQALYYCKDGKYCTSIFSKVQSFLTSKKDYLKNMIGGK